MKTKITLATLCVLVSVAYAANYFYGKKMASELDGQIKAIVEKNELPVKISYSDLDVNPLFSKIIFSNVQFSQEKQGTVRSKELELNIPYSEAQRLLESTEFEELNSFELNFSELSFSDKRDTLLHTVDELRLDFDGHLTKADIEQIQEKFPETDQHIQFSFTNLSVGLGKGKPRQAQEHVMEIYNQFVTGVNGNFTMHYLADKQQVEFHNISIDSKAYSYSGNSVIDINGSGFNEMKPGNMVTRSEMRINPETVEWTNGKGEKGIFSLEELRVKTDITKDLNKMQLPVGEAQMNIDKLIFKEPGNGKPKGMFAVGALMQNMEIEKLHLDYAFNENNLLIKDSEIRSSMLDATIMADITIDQFNPQQSSITAGKVVINKIAPDLEQVVSMFEMQSGSSLPRQNGAIVLELSGKLMKPDIKDFKY